MTATTQGSARPWWRDAVFYEVYIRSFADGNGDGVGDLSGIRSRLGYLADLGVDALWVTPFYPSPMADGGYDVADYRDVDPMFGTLDDLDALVADAHAAGLRVIIDLVPNHTSSEHPWFRAAVAAAPGSAERARYFFRPGRGPHGDEPPNDWQSVFGGPAWTQVERRGVERGTSEATSATNDIERRGVERGTSEATSATNDIERRGVERGTSEATSATSQQSEHPDAGPGEWYLHLFAPGQPDLDWRNPQVGDEFESVLRFWLDRGVDGFRIDVAHGLLKHEQLPDAPGALHPDLTFEQDLPGPIWDQPEVHDVYRRWRTVLDSYPGERMAVGEAWVFDPESLARYIRPDELHQAFNFGFLGAPWDAAAWRRVVDASLQATMLVDATTTWVLSNHDVVRHVTRYGGGELGVRRARAAVLFMLALPGSVYLYQGEELGLREITELPEEVLADPVWERSGFTEKGRDGCRVPLPWSGSAPPYGFSPDGASPWLPQPGDFAALTADAQAGDPSSMLTLYREALRLRSVEPALGEGALRWRDGPEDTVVISREGDPGVVCTVNMGDSPVPLTRHEDVLLASSPLPDEGTLPPDTAVWLRTGSGR